MFGYVLPDKPNMFMKDFTLYKAFYCGLCKTIGQMYGQFMRFSTNYDITFLSVLAHSIYNIDIEISNEVCILNPIKKKSIVKTDELNKKIVDINTILMHYKCVDDIIDNHSFGKKVIDDTIIKKHYKKARKNLPCVDIAVENGYKELRTLEKENCGIVDKVAHQFAMIMQNIGQDLFAEKFNDSLAQIMYNIGKWIYIVDAIDDIDDDYKEKKYNMFLVDYKYKDRQTFLEEKKELLENELYGCYNSISSAFENIKLEKYEGIITNILWYGMLEETKDILRRTKKCSKTHI